MIKNVVAYENRLSSRFTKEKVLSDRLCLWFRMRVDRLVWCYDNESRVVQQVWL